MANKRQIASSSVAPSLSAPSVSPLLLLLLLDPVGPSRIGHNRTHSDPPNGPFEVHFGPPLGPFWLHSWPTLGPLLACCGPFWVYVCFLLLLPALPSCSSSLLCLSLIPIVLLFAAFFVPNSQNTCGFQKITVQNTMRSNYSA